MKAPRFQVYPAKDGYRWRLKAANGRIIAESGEAYTRKRDCIRAVEVVRSAVAATSTKAPVLNFAVRHAVDAKAVAHAVAQGARHGLQRMR